MNGDARLRGAVLRAAAGAAKDTPGVAFLRPGFGELLRRTVPGRPSRTGSPAAAAPAAPAVHDGRVAGVRAERGPGPGQWRIRVHLAVRRGHRALDVTRAVRPRVVAAVREALEGAPGEEGGGPPVVTVTVTVTDIT
ncbi:Asp23/Gls24 family envelope stress response protein [Streptomyces albofaciens]|uniref:Asp23/Gls24 family envelope stress response protein n=1 Tax=Streptomyces albofaciens TaxID=66866 RepID=UPI001AD6ADCA|nr:Asp23/Gls24 family envelope stress response protein [Streptomyces albofaciens]